MHAPWQYRRNKILMKSFKDLREWEEIRCISDMKVLPIVGDLRVRGRILCTPPR